MGILHQRESSISADAINYLEISLPITVHTFDSSSYPPQDLDLSRDTISQESGLGTEDNALFQCSSG